MSEWRMRAKIDILRAELVRVADWLDRLAESSRRQYETVKDRFPALAEAVLADARNFSATRARILDAITRANAIPVRDRKGTRPRATDVACPRCKAAVDRPCIRDDGTPFKAPADSHRERRELARDAP